MIDHNWISPVAVEIFGTLQSFQFQEELSY